MKENSFSLLITSLLICFIFIIIYKYLYMKIFELLPKSFTLGEACIVLQGLLLFIMNSIFNIPKFLIENPKMKLMEMHAIMMVCKKKKRKR